VTNLTRILSLFPAIESLSTRHLSPPRSQGVWDGRGILDILSTEHCLQLRAIDIGTWPELAPFTLSTWLSTRSEPESGCCKLSKVVVTSEKPLPLKTKAKIAPLLDKFIWRKFMVPKPLNNGQYLQPPLRWYPPPVLTASIPSSITSVNTTQLIEDGSWDEDDEEEWARVPYIPDPIPPYSPNANFSVQDDPTLIYCDQALRGRWDYFSMPSV